MLAKLWVAWPQLLILLLAALQLPIALVSADVSHLAKEYLPPEGATQVATAPARPQADEPEPEPAPADPQKANDGAYYPTAGLMLPPGYAIPTGSNVAPPPASPPNFPLPIYPPFFGFGGGSEGIGGVPLPPGYPNEAQLPIGAFPVGSQPGQFPIGGQHGGAQGVPFPVGPQPAQFGTAPFAVGGTQGAFPNGPQAGPFPNGPQAGPFPNGPQAGPFPNGQTGAGFPIDPQAVPFPAGPQGLPFPQGAQGGLFPFPPDYLTTQGLPSSGMQLPFQQNVGLGTPPGFAGLQPGPAYPYQELVNVGQPFAPSFGIPGQHYQPQPPPQAFADEPQSAPKSSPPAAATPSPVPVRAATTTATTTTIAPVTPKSLNRDTIYAPNGGYVYQRAK
ncbi:hypothetical protein KR222_011260 [Zaprionus bogoriensis]|nr:hypothetical protein KR222_011260 [Zaprionus bogoriensis]